MWRHSVSRHRKRTHQKPPARKQSCSYGLRQLRRRPPCGGNRRRHPLHQWFKESLEDNMEIPVSSYHHQGVKRLAHRFKPMAFAPDGLIEGFYDPDAYYLEEGKFIMGLQFHPGRMRKQNSDEFDYPRCTAAYKVFPLPKSLFQ